MGPFQSYLLCQLDRTVGSRHKVAGRWHARLRQRPHRAIHSFPMPYRLLQAVTVSKGLTCIWLEPQWPVHSPKTQPW